MTRAAEIAEEVADATSSEILIRRLATLMLAPSSPKKNRDPGSDPRATTP